MANKDIVVIGASIGGIEALKGIAEGLPGDLKSSVFIVLHTGASSPENLDKILARAGKLPVSYPRDSERFQPGRAYIAPADRHLLLEPGGFLRVTRGPKENRFRPAIDPLFRSAAVAYSRRVVGVILTGALDDGTAGLWAVKERGGVAIVQNPEEAVAPSMPLSALKHVEIDHCVRLVRIPGLLAELSRTPAEERGLPPAGRMAPEVNIAEGEIALESGVVEMGSPSLFACPECHGVLLQFMEGSNLRFRCHTGHAYSVETLLRSFEEQTESALWNAVRSIEETVLLLQRMARQLREHRHEENAAALERHAEDAFARASLIRNIVLRTEGSGGRAEH